METKKQSRIKPLVSHRFKQTILYTVLIITSALQAFPLVWLTNFSLCKDSELFVSGILKWPEEFMWENYRRAWVDGHILQNLLNSLLVCAATLLIVIVCSLLLSYAFTRIVWKGRSVVFYIILLGMMIPIQATLIPNFLVFNQLGLTNSYLGLIIPYAAFSLPLATFIMTGFMKSIPKALEEAAILDGCGTPRLIFNVIRPLVTPAIVSVTVLTFLNTWNEFVMAYTFTSKSMYRTLPFSVYEFAGLYSKSYSTQFAVMVIASLPALIVYMLLSDQITKGITMGALKS